MYHINIYAIKCVTPTDGVNYFVSTYAEVKSMCVQKFVVTTSNVYALYGYLSNSQIMP